MEILSATYSGTVVGSTDVIDVIGLVVDGPRPLDIADMGVVTSDVLLLVINSDSVDGGTTVVGLI